MNLTPEQQRELAKFPPVLRALIEAELAAGNTIEEIGHSHPAPPVGAYFKLTNKVSTRPRTSGGGIDFYDRNSSIYSGEFTDAKRFFFILEPPNPPPPEPDMDAIRKAPEPKPDSLGQLAQRAAGSSIEIATGISRLEETEVSKKKTPQPKETLKPRRVLESTETATGVKRILHFEDKRDLVFQVCEETFGRLVTELGTLDTEFKDPVERLRHGMHRYVAFGLRHPQHYLATFVAVPQEQLPEDIERYNNPESNGMHALGILRACVAACIESHAFRPVDPDVTSRALWTNLHGVTALLIQMPNFSWGDQQAVIDTVVDTAIEGLRLRKRR